MRLLVCPVCGKKFIPAPMHIYKVQNCFVCSWGCQRKFEKEQEARKKKVRKNGDKQRKDDQFEFCDA